MKFKIVEEKYGDGSNYYIVQVNRWYGWGIYNEYSCQKISKFHVGPSMRGYFNYKHFSGIDEAEKAIESVKVYLESKNHSRDIKIIE